MESIIEQDINKVLDSGCISWDRLKGKRIFVTGGTGLIGYTLIASLLLADTKKKLNLSLILLVRDKNLAEKRFSSFATLIAKGKLTFVLGNVEESNWKEKITEKIDLIIHAASNTSSICFVRRPVETINTAVLGTKNTLEFARNKDVESYIYLSSMEVYGFPPKGHKIEENEIGNITSLDVRNSYPISKLICESMCIANHAEYGVPVKILRLTQTFGPGVHPDDSRVFAYFLRCAMNKEDIVLKTKGETERSYLYTVDAVTAILAVLLSGENGQAYNAADENTYCSIKDMANIVAKEYCLNIRCEIEEEKLNGFPPVLYMDMDTRKIQKLNWKPTGGTLANMYKRTFEWMKSNES